MQFRPSLTIARPQQLSSHFSRYTRDPPTTDEPTQGADSSVEENDGIEIQAESADRTGYKRGWSPSSPFFSDNIRVRCSRER